ncbi:DUF2339 domain-containing protein [Caulobacter sp. SLTY]|uniref:DUF2339 domain-containing protein n=1 Tax=Caulobacter sp. SLTY TaxID=2683262 RepID=UPI001412BBAB|nr:DUF2339 domain-containing protein [Caulobacter sp. SLTY]
MTPPPRPPPSIDLGALLAEKGLAWLGGGGLVLGGVFLVGYAAQQGLLTPLVRLVMAIALAGAMLMASEVLRRRPGPRGQQLASAVLAGAGASTLYATVWAAHALYDFIGAGLSGGLLLAVSGGLLALSTRRREPLALMALFGALAAPLLTRPQDWSEPALFLHLLAVAATGVVVGARRGWGASVLSAVAGALILNFVTAPDADTWRLTLAPLALAGLALAYRSRVNAAMVRYADAVLPCGLTLASFSAMVLFLHAADPVAVAAGCATAVILGALAAEAVRRGGGPSWLLAPPIAVLVAGLTGVIAYAPSETLELARAAAVLAAIPLVLIGLRALEPQRRDNPILAIPPVALLLLAAAAGFGLKSPAAALLPLAAGVPAALAAVWLHRRSPGPTADLHLDAWALAAAATLLMAIRQSAPLAALPPAFAGAALLLALLQRRVGWRALSLAAMAAAGLATASGLAPESVEAALAGPGGAGLGLVASLSAAGLTALAAWRIAPAPPFGATRQVLGAAAVAQVLIGAFLALRFAASGDQPAIGPLMESALRTLLLALAGGSALLALRDLRGLIVRVGPHLLLGAAALHALCGPMTIRNPWWGLWSEAVGPIPLINILLLAFLAPAAVFGVAATRLYRAGRPLGGRIYGAIAAVLALTWAILETRRLFHPVDLAVGATSFAEICALGLILLLAPPILRRVGPQAARADARRTAEVAGLLAPPFVLMLTGLFFCPWWGAADTPLGPPAISFALLAGVVALSAWNGAALRDAAREIGLTVAGLQALLLTTLAVRWLFEPAMAGGRIESFESWTYSAAWALFGAGLLALASAWRERALRWLSLAVLLTVALKVVLIDMASLDGVTRAASFLVVGALMVAAAVMARRLGRPTGDQGEKFTND